jgi:hypothetical protein
MNRHSWVFPGWSAILADSASVQDRGFCFRFELWVSGAGSFLGTVRTCKELAIFLSVFMDDHVICRSVRGCKIWEGCSWVGKTIEFLTGRHSSSRRRSTRTSTVEAKCWLCMLCSLGVLADGPWFCQSVRRNGDRNYVLHKFLVFMVGVT